jgi:cytochrome P450
MLDADLPIDPLTPGLFTRSDYFELLARLRREAPVFDCAPGTWIVTRYGDVRDVSRDPERFCSSRGVLMHDPLRSGGTVHGSILHMDPPDHAPWRKLASRRFTPRAVAALEDRVRAIARAVLDAAPVGREIDFIDQIAAPFPVLVIAELLGVGDGDLADFRRWSDATIESPDAADVDIDAIAQLYRFLVDHVRARRTEPRDDMTSMLVAGEIDGETISTPDAVGYVLSLLIAGNETTRHLVSGSALALFEHPEQRELLTREPHRIANAVEECLRWVTPVQSFGRTATRDTEVGGVAIAEGDFVVMMYASANRDDAVFGATADRFDVTRAFDSAHLAFGFGEHLCLGAALARLEARVLLEELLTRFPDYEVVGSPAWVHSTLVRGMSQLPTVLR